MEVTQLFDPDSLCLNPKSFPENRKKKLMCMILLKNAIFKSTKCF